MLNKNIRNFRINKGMSQEELAAKLNVVRQTVSKWEKGLSVPDSEMLIKISEVLDISVNVLLGEAENNTSEIKEIAEKLEILNEQFKKQNESRRKLIRYVLIGVIVISASVLLSECLTVLTKKFFIMSIEKSTEIIGGIDGPTQIVTASAVNLKNIVSVIAVILSSLCLIKMRRK